MPGPHGVLGASKDDPYGVMAARMRIVQGEALWFLQWMGRRPIEGDPELGPPSAY